MSGEFHKRCEASMHSSYFSERQFVLVTITFPNGSNLPLYNITYKFQLFGVSLKVSDSVLNIDSKKSEIKN